MKQILETQGWTHKKGDVCNCSGPVIQYWRNTAFPGARVDVMPASWWFLIKKEGRTVKLLSAGDKLEGSLKQLQLWKS